MSYTFPSPTIRYDGEAGTAFEGLYIEVRQVRTGTEIRAILSPIEHWSELHAVMAPFVVGWNYEGYREETDDPTEDGARPVKRLVPTTLPAPSDAGPDIFVMVDRTVMDWIRGKLIESVSWKPDASDPKAPQTPSESTPDGEFSATSTQNPDTESGKTRRRARSS